MDPYTVANFWDRYPELHAWVKEDTVTPEQGMLQIARFLEVMGQSYDLRFVSKPAAWDIGRFQYCMTRYTASRFVPHYTSICLTTQKATLGRVLNASIDRMDDFLAPAKARLGVELRRPTHFPLEDCRLQAAEFLALDEMMTRMTPTS